MTVPSPQRARSMAENAHRRDPRGACPHCHVNNVACMTRALRGHGACCAHCGTGPANPHQPL